MAKPKDSKDDKFDLGRALKVIRDRAAPGEEDKLKGKKARGNGWGG